MKGCFAVGLYRQGICHDLSKYSWTEFRVGAKYYQGNRSPNNAEREDIGYSSAWLHHKGRNKHHYEYWNDYNPKTKRLEGVKMPDKYFVEMVCDRIAASKIYYGDNYTDNAPLNYFLGKKGKILINKDTEKELEYVLRMLADKGEKRVFRYLRKKVRKARTRKVNNFIGGLARG